MGFLSNACDGMDLVKNHRAVHTPVVPAGPRLHPANKPFPVRNLLSGPRHVQTGAVPGRVAAAVADDWQEIGVEVNDALVQAVVPVPPWRRRNTPLCY